MPRLGHPFLDHVAGIAEEHLRRAVDVVADRAAAAEEVVRLIELEPDQHEAIRAAVEAVLSVARSHRAGWTPTWT